MGFYIKRGEKIQGPFNREKVVAFAEAGKIVPTDLVSEDELGPFQQLSEVWNSFVPQDQSPSSTESDGRTCQSCGATVFQTAATCPKCFAILADSVAANSLEPLESGNPFDLNQQLPPNSFPAQPVIPPAPSPVDGQNQMPIAQPVPQPIAQPVPQPIAQPVPQPIAQPVPQPIAQPVPQPIAQPIAQPFAQPASHPATYQQGGVANAASRPRKKVKKKQNEDPAINHRLIGIACGGVGLIIIVLLFKFVLTPSLEGKANRLANRLLETAVQAEVIMASNGLGKRLDDKLAEMAEIEKQLEEVKSKMTLEQRTQWEEKWIKKLIEKKIRF